MKFGKRQLVIAGMVVALGAAVYLNWQFSSGQPVSTVESSSLSSTKQLGQTTYVNTDVSAVKTTSTQQSKQESETEQSSKTVTDHDTFFTTERTKRDSARKQAQAGLEKIVSDINSDGSAKQKAVEAAQELADNIKAESDIETEIISKGFSDCIVSINQSSCSVIVPKGKLSEALAIAIKDSVKRNSGVEFDKITISEV